MNKKRNFRILCHRTVRTLATNITTRRGHELTPNSQTAAPDDSLEFLIVRLIIGYSLAKEKQGDETDFSYQNICTSRSPRLHHPPSPSARMVE